MKRLVDCSDLMPITQSKLKQFYRNEANIEDIKMDEARVYGFQVLRYSFMNESEFLEFKSALIQRCLKNITFWTNIKFIYNSTEDDSVHQELTILLNTPITMDYAKLIQDQLSGQITSCYILEIQNG